MVEKPSREDEAKARAKLMAARVGMIMLIVVLSAITLLVPTLRGFFKYVLIFGVGALLTSGSISEQMKFRAWKKKMERR